MEINKNKTTKTTNTYFKSNVETGETEFKQQENQFKMFIDWNY